MIADVFFKTTHHFFPKLSKWLNTVDDPRVLKKTKYSSSHLLRLGVFLFLMRLGSKRQIKYLFSTEEFRKNLGILCQSFTDSIAHHDTLENLVKKLNPDEVSAVRHKMITRLIRTRLIRMKCLSPFPSFGQILYGCCRRYRSSCIFSQALPILFNQRKGWKDYLLLS